MRKRPALCSVRNAAINIKCIIRWTKRYYQIDITKLQPPEGVQASSNIRQIVRLKSNITSIDNIRETT